MHNTHEGCAVMFKRKKKKVKTKEELFELLLNEILDEKAKGIWERLKEI